MSTSRHLMTPAQIAEVFSRFSSKNPHPTTELIYRNEFELLIAVILSAQATDKAVNKATQALFLNADTPQKMCALGEKKLKALIQSIGLYNTKAKNILKTCEILVRDYASCVPHQRADLERLPGVGRKTANVILNTAFGQPTLAVDTHIFRVAHRMGLAEGKTPLSVEKTLLDRIPKPYLQHAHHWLILHGRYTCLARKPRCGQCDIADLCSLHVNRSESE